MDYLARGLASLSAEDLSKLRYFVAAHYVDSLPNGHDTREKNHLRSRVLYMGLLSGSVTQDQLNFLCSLLDGVEEVTLKVNPNGNRYAFLCFQNSSKADLGKLKLEKLKQRLLEANYESLFHCGTVVSYRGDVRGSSDCTGVYVGNLQPAVTKRDLVQLGIRKFGHQGFTTVFLSDPSEVAGMNFAILNFMTHEDAAKAKAILKQLKMEELDKRVTKPIFSRYSRIDYAFPPKDK